MKQNLYLFIILSFCLSTTILSQNDEWAVYDTTDYDLPSARVDCIAIDIHGNKWLSNWYGLVKFDDTEWIVYDSSNSGLPSNEVSCIAIDESDNKWIGTRYGGLVNYDDTEWIVYDTSNSGLPSNYIHCLTIDKTDILWLAAGVKLVKIDNSDWTVYDSTNSGLPSSGISCLTVDESNNLWIGTFGDGFVKYDGINWTTYNAQNLDLPARGVISIAVDKKGIVWFGSGNPSWGWDGAGLVKFEEIDSTLTVYNISNSPLLSGQIECITIDEENNKWIAMQVGNGYIDGGLARIDSDDTTWTVYTVSNSGLPSNYVKEITIDKFGNKWIGFAGWGYGNSNIAAAVYNEGGIITNVQNDTDTESLPNDYILSQNYPNPFNPTTTIQYTIPVVALSEVEVLHVTLKVYDILGREVATLVNKNQKPGSYNVEFDGYELTSGIYYYKLTAGNFNQTKKMLLIK